MNYEKHLNCGFSNFKLEFGFGDTMVACRFNLSDPAIRVRNVLPRHLQRELAQRDANQIKVFRDCRCANNLMT
jgi:hypothetical protein